MRTVITGHESLSCFGDADATFEALCAGRTGAQGLRGHDPARVGVTHAHHADVLDDPAVQTYRATRMLRRVLRSATHRAGVSTAPGGTVAARRVAVIVGTGLRELVEAERWRVLGTRMTVSDLHFASTVREVLPGVTEVLTVAGACSASGYALAMGQDLLASGEADVVVVAGTDTMTTSLLAVMGRGMTRPSERVRPFDVDRQGVLLGDGAAAVVLERDGEREHPRPFAVLHGVGLSCDAHHETAPAAHGIEKAMYDAFARTGREAREVDLVVAHGTGTALNDPMEAHVIAGVHHTARPAVTAIKGGTGHTSGAASLMSVIVAAQTMRDGVVPPIHGLRTPIPEAEFLDLVRERPREATPRLAQVNAFGFGGVNAVALVGAAA